MEPDQYLDAITKESAALADAAESVGLDAAVPSCPEWNVADLVAHVGEVQQWARILVEERASERISRRSLPSAPAAPELIPWFRLQAPALVAALESTDPATPMWAFSGEQTAWFWFRRQAHEVAIHRWDAQLAGGNPDAIETELAADGVDERLDLLRSFDAITGNGETIHLHCTDTTPDVGGEWFVRLVPDGLEIERVHAKGDVAARATASILDLFSFGRVGASELDVFGDADLLERFQAATNF